MVNKKGYMKTLEAVLAIVIFLIFVTTALVFNKAPEEVGVPQDIEVLQNSILTKIESDLTLRNCLVTNQMNCINQTIISLVPSQTIDYSFEICVTDTPSDCILTIYTNSMILQESGQTVVFRLFLWKNL